MALLTAALAISVSSATALLPVPHALRQWPAVAYDQHPGRLLPPVQEPIETLAGASTPATRSRLADASTGLTAGSNARGREVAVGVRDQRIVSVDREEETRRVRRELTEVFFRRNSVEDPVRWDPCQVIHYAINLRDAPVGGERIIHQAVARASALSGLRFAYDGPTAAAPGPDGRRSRLDPVLYGDRWAPVLFAWGTERTYPVLVAETLGHGGSARYASRGAASQHLVSGTVLLDSEDVRWLVESGRAARVRNLVLHEVGHVLGIGHTEQAEGALMHPSLAPGTALDDRDRALFALAGQGTCYPGD